MSTGRGQKKPFCITPIRADTNIHMTDRRTYLHPVVFVLLHLAAVQSVIYLLYFNREIFSLAWVPMLAILIPVVPMLRVTGHGRRKAYVISMVIAGLSVLPMAAYFWLAWFVLHDRIG